MGGHYGSVQLRTTDRAAVLAAADTVATARGIKCLVGPALNGWVGVYPEGHGQDQTVGEQIAARVGGYGLHLLVHDDDVLAYWLWKDGKLIDRYWSKPGYFREENRAEEESLVGEVKKFGFVIDDSSQRKLRQILSREYSPPMEYERLQKVGRVLGIRRLAEAYEYLNEEERSTGTRRQFIEVPADPEAMAADAAERKAKRKQRAAVESAARVARKNLVAEGMLLATEERDGSFGPSLELIVDGFAAAWFSFYPRPSQILLHRAPWNLSTPVRSLEVPEDAGAFVAASADGKRLATKIDHAVHVWEATINDEWRHLGDIPLTDQFASVALSPDGSTIAYADEQEVIGIEIASGRKTFSAAGLNRSPLVFDSSGSSLVQVGRTVRSIERTASTTTTRDLYVGGIRPDQTTAGRYAVAWMIAARGVQPPIGSCDSSWPKAPQESVEKVHCVGFSRDGRWIWFGTDTSLLVFDRSALPVGGGPLIATHLRFDIPRSLPPASTAVMVAVEDAMDSCVVCGCGDGRVYRMNLTFGGVVCLLSTPPGGCYVTGLCLIEDRSVLAVASHRSRQPTRARPARHVLTLDVWNYQRLLTESDHAQRL